MTVRRVPRESTESALNYLRSTYQEHRRAVSSPASATGRVRTATTSLGYFDAEAAAQQGWLLRLISVVEAYVDSLSYELLIAASPAPGTLFRRLVDDAVLRSASTWQERRDAFAALHDVGLGSLPRWSELDAGIEVRNSIAHGLGRLTFKQRPKVANLTSKFGQLGVRLSDGRLVISEQALRRGLDVCLEFVEALDQAVPTEASK